MANFYIQSNIQVIPIEEIAFTDTNQKAKGIHSTIDKVFGATSTASLGTTATNIFASTISVAGYSGGTLASLLGISVDATIAFLYIKINNPAHTHQAYVEIKATDGAGSESANIYLGLGQDFFCLNILLAAEDIVLSNAFSSTVNFDILVGKVG